MRKIKAIVKRVDEPYGHVTNLSDSLEALQKAVGGHIEAVTLPAGVVILCDEEGRINGKPYNCAIYPHAIAAKIDFYGDIVAVGTEGEEFADIPIDIKTWKKIYLGKEEA